MEQHLRRYMVNYYREHAELPTGRHYLGRTRPLNLEVGMINFDAIRSEIRAHRMQERHTARERAGYLREIMKKEEMPKNEVG